MWARRYGGVTTIAVQHSMFERLKRLLRGRSRDSEGREEQQRIQGAHARLVAEYGPFAIAFSSEGISVPGYMTLLNIWADRPDVHIVLDRIGTAARSGDTDRWVEALFANPDWRPHLVGALASLLTSNTSYVPLVWQAIDRGSWVTPQLVATACLLDSEFSQHARQRVHSGCPITVPPNLTPLQRHSATGPAGRVARSGKLLASILALCQDSEMEVWTKDAKEPPELAKLLGEDIDDSGDIAKGWLEQVQTILRKRQHRV